MSLSETVSQGGVPATLLLVRSQVGSGRVTSIDTGAAEESPGILAVLTRHDIDGALSNGDPVIASEIAFPGQVLAAVVGETDYAASDGAELVDIVVEPVDPPVAAGTRAADEAPGEDGLTCELVQPRWHVAPLQTSQCVAEPAGDADRTIVVRTPAREPEAMARALAAAAGLPPSRVRVEAADERGRSLNVPDVLHSGHVLAVVAADRLSRAVRWQESRAESLTTGGAQAGFHGVATLHGTPGASDANLTLGLRADAGAGRIHRVGAADDASRSEVLSAQPWYGLGARPVEVTEDRTNLPPAHVDAAAVLGQVLLTEAVLTGFADSTGASRTEVQAAAAAAGGELATRLLGAARGTEVDRGTSTSAEAAAAALAPGVAAFAVVRIDRSTGEWAPVSISLAVPGAVSQERRLALTAGAVDGFGVAAMQQIQFDEQGNCLEATLMDYVMPTSWEAPEITVVGVAAPDDVEAPAEVPTDLLRTLATGAAAGAIKSAVSVLVPGLSSRSAPLTSSDTWEAVAR